MSKARTGRSVKTAEPEDAAPATPHPRQTPALEGHEEAASAFLKAVAKGALHHAWLLTGEAGIGKATFAYLAAKTLLAGEGTGPDSRLGLPAGHPVAKQVAAGAHPSLFALEAASATSSGAGSSIAVDEVRGLRAFLRLTASGPARAIIVDDAARLTGGAANALLKAVEEPPKGAVFFLIARSPGEVLPTIRSRCAKLALRPLPQPAFRRAVERACAAGGLQQPGAEDLAALERRAAGSPGRALHFLASGGLSLLSDAEDLAASLPGLDRRRLHGLIATALAGEKEGQFALLCDFLEESLERSVERGAARGEGGGKSVSALVRRAELWEKMRAWRRDMESLNLDKASFLFQSFLDMASLAREEGGVFSA
jgi:DNA polymerase-3 subunit delta'